MTERRWLVIGHLGMLGTDLMSVLAERDASGVDRPNIDITVASSVDDAVTGYDVVVNCAAYTAVDDAESHEAIAHAVNADGPANIARACARTGARMVHISTDYVFAGTATEPYSEDSPLDPRSAYGRTKAAGEQQVRAIRPNDSLILRTAWLYGAHGPNFVRTMMGLEASRDTLDVVNDQRGQPTWARDLAARIVASVDANIAPGVYHATSSGDTTWFGLTRRIFDKLGADPERVRPTTTDAFPRPAPRPRYSVLGHRGWEAAGLSPLPHWSDALDAAWPELTAASQRG